MKVNRTNLSVTISNTPPSLDVWLKARAAIPSATSKIALIQYNKAQYLGWFAIEWTANPANIILAYPIEK